MAVESNDNIIDSLDVEQEIAEIREALDGPVGRWTTREELEDRLATLEEFAEQGRAFDDWDYGIQLIHEDYFEEYAEEFYRDVYGAVPEYLADHIDWEGVAEDLRVDYSELTFEGSVYFTR